MPKHTVVLWPKGTVLSPSPMIDPGSSPYPSSNTPSITLHEAWKDGGAQGIVYGDGTTNEAATYSYRWIYPNQVAGTWRHAVSFDPPPTLSVYTKLTFTCYFDFAYGHGFPLYLPPDVAYAPRVRFIIRTRDQTDWTNVSSWYPSDAGITGDHSINVLTKAAGPACPFKAEWALTAHPESGIWSLSDLENLAAGVEIGVAQNASESPWFPKFRMLKFYVVVEVLDLGGDVEAMRHATSQSLRYYRRKRNAIKITMPAQYAQRAVYGELSYISHPLGPGVDVEGWGERLSEREPAILLKRVYLPGQLAVEDTYFHARDYLCLAWGVYAIDASWTPELQGMVYLDQGGGWTHTRAQDGWSIRRGDGVSMRVIEAYPNLSFEGLALQGGSDVAISHWNSNPAKASGAGNLWSDLAIAGTLTLTSPKGWSLVEELGYEYAQVYTFGASPGGTGGRQQTLGVIAPTGGHRLNVRVVVKNQSVATPASQCLEYRLWRTDGSGTEYFDFAAGTWGASTVNNPIPSDKPYGELLYDGIPCDSTLGAPVTYHHAVGRWSSAIISAVFVGALADVQKGGPSYGASYGCRSPLVTLGADTTRVADVHELDNVNHPVWLFGRGVAWFDVRPFWKASLLPASTVKPFASARWDQGSYYDSLLFVAGATDLVRFRRLTANEDFTLDCPIASLHLTRAHRIRAWVRWLDAEGWREYAPYAVTVGYAVFNQETGALVQAGRTTGLRTYTGAASTPSWLRLGSDATPSYLDGFLRAWETMRNPITEDEILWKR